jgi:cytochrome P450/NADPH-cytochrome P450 reductase
MNIQSKDTHLEPIPQPPAKFLLGNLLDLLGDTHTQDIIKLAREYGPIFQLELPGRTLVVVSGHDLVDELCNEERFDKKVWPPLRKVRSFAGDGLFTAETEEPNWHKAHNILMPNFSMKAMQGYHPMMIDIAEQLMAKWERSNADDEIDIPGDMTRLTLDTIGLCGFDYRFNSFYRENMHPFVQSMIQALAESMDSLNRLPVQEKLLIHKHRQMQNDIDFMNETVDRIIKERKELGVENSPKQDLLYHMLAGKDKQSGEQLDDINIRYQIITFLIAGHETTSGLLSFATYFLLQHPEVLAKAYDEVDHVLGNDITVPPTFAQVNRLRYISQILKEALRLWPTAPMFAVDPYENETVIGGKYKITKDMNVAVLIPMLHRDKSVWGDDAEEFNPDHFAPEMEQNLPPNAFKAFGNGQRACIGRQFALQEATLVLGMVLQRFKLIDFQNYQLKIKETLTLKPENFKMRVKLRTDADRSVVAVPARQEAEQPVKAPIPITASNVPQHHTPLLVLFGSNLGTSEDIAHRIGEDGAARGFDATIATLDDYTGKLPDKGALVIVTASYNGTPPDNAGQFVHWLKGNELAKDALRNVNYSVFGCGNHEWASTFQAVPRLIDAQMEMHGAKRIYQRGEGDAADDFDGQFQSWYQNFWPSIASSLALNLGENSTASKGQMYEIDIISDAEPANPYIASFGAQPMKVIENRELQQHDGSTPSERSTRHIEVALPANMFYRAGDHLGILARNSTEQIQRVMRRFGFDPAAKIRIRKSDMRKTHLPTDEPIWILDLLANYVELQDVATRSQIKVMAEHTQCPPDKKKLLALAGDDEQSTTRYREEVLAKRKSLIDLLEEFPACELPFNVYLELLSPIRPRYYSISSSPLMKHDQASITVGVVRGSAKSGRGTFEGMCSTYLAREQQGNTLYAFVQDTKSRFRLPDDQTTPLIMVGPGTGLAPFRGFLQERAALQGEGKAVGTSLLFFGCRHPQQDFIYEDELTGYVKQGIAELYVAFSREKPGTKVYVQDKIRGNKERVWELLEQGASIYVCGDASQMAPDVQQAFKEIYREKTGKSEQEAEQWLSELMDEDRYLIDVWG